MKIVINKSELWEAVKMLSRVINKKSPIPVLANLLCDVKDNTLTMTASDSEAVMTKTVSLDLMEGDGKFMVNAAELTAALNTLEPQSLTIIADVENGEAAHFRMEHEQGHYYFPLYVNVEEYPTREEEIYPEEITMDGKALKDALKRGAWSAAKDDLRPMLNGAHFKLKDGNLDVVTTDGHTIVLSSIYMMPNVSAIRCGSFTLSSRSVNIIQSVIGGWDVDIHWNKSRVEVVQDTVRMSFTQIEGTYPNYNSVIPTDFKHKAVMSRDALISALKKVTPFTNESTHTVTMDFASGRLLMKGEDTDFARGAEVVIPVDYLKGCVKVHLKGDRVITMLSHHPAGDITIKIVDPSRAIIIEPKEQPSDADILMLIMPTIGVED